MWGVSVILLLYGLFFLGLVEFGSAFVMYSVFISAKLTSVVCVCVCVCVLVSHVTVLPSNKRL